MAYSYKENKVGTHKTVIGFNAKGMQTVKYHDTDVVTWDFDTIVLNTGGWRTVTTKLRMNQASKQFGLGYYVWQKDYKWFVDFREATIPYTNEKLVLPRPLSLVPHQTYGKIVHSNWRVSNLVPEITQRRKVTKDDTP